MADLAWRARSPLDGRNAPRRTAGTPGVVVSEQGSGRTVAVLARRGATEALTERCRGFGVVLPGTPKRVAGRGYAIVWTAPGQWLVQADDREIGRLERLFSSFPTLCSTVALDDSRIILSVEGPRMRDALAKMLTLDLHPRVFRPGDAAVTVAGGMSVYLWLRDDVPVFDLAVPRSVAGSFWDWLMGSAAEYGVAVGQPDAAAPVSID